MSDPSLSILTCPECGLENLKTRVICFRCKAKLGRKAERTNGAEGGSEAARTDQRKRRPRPGWPPPPVTFRLKPEVKRDGDPKKAFFFSTVARDGAPPEEADNVHYVDREFKEIASISEEALPEPVKQEIAEERAQLDRQRQAAALRRGRTAARALILGAVAMAGIGWFLSIYLVPERAGLLVLLDVVLGLLAAAVLVRLRLGRFAAMGTFGLAWLASLLLKGQSGGLAATLSSFAGLAFFFIVVMTLLLTVGVGLALGIHLELRTLEEES